MDLDISDWNETCISLPSLWENTEDEFLLSNSGNMWNELSFPTPPNTPTEFSPPDCTRTTTKYEHCLAHERRDELISEDELDSEFARELRARAESPAILNDVMWSGELVKRTEFDCCIELEVRFSHSSTPTRFEEQISNSLVEHEELLAFSFFGNQADVSDGESTEDSCVTNSTEAGGRDGFSESGELYSFSGFPCLVLRYATKHTDYNLLLIVCLGFNQSTNYCGSSLYFCVGTVFCFVDSCCLSTTCLFEWSFYPRRHYSGSLNS